MKTKPVIWKKGKLLKVIGYQPDTLCTLKDLQKFDDMWYSMRPNPPLINNYTPSKFTLSEAAKEVFIRQINLFKL